MLSPVKFSIFAYFYNQLGFHKKYDGRSREVLDEWLDLQKIDLLSQGDPRALNHHRSYEAYRLAVEFFVDSGIGERLWPDNSGGPWSTWSKNTPK